MSQCCRVGMWLHVCDGYADTLKPASAGVVFLFSVLFWCYGEFYTRPLVAVSVFTLAC